MKLTSTYIITWLYLLIYCGPAQTKVSLRVHPRTQFFKSESILDREISLSCEEEGISVPGWSVRRHTIKEGKGTCNSEFGEIKGSSCNMLLYEWDGGVYWCQSESEDLSDRVNISISDVILEISDPPVVEGSNATLRCLSMTTGEPSYDRPADFFRNGSIIFRDESTGEMTIQNVSKSDEGFYKCHITGLGESSGRWMEVGDSSSSPTPEPTSESKADRPMSVLHTIVHVLLPIPWLVSTILYMGILRDRARARARAFVRGGDNNDVIMAVAV